MVFPLNHPISQLCFNQTTTLCINNTRQSCIKCHHEHLNEMFEDFCLKWNHAHTCSHKCEIHWLQPPWTGVQQQQHIENNKSILTKCVSNFDMSCQKFYLSFCLDVHFRALRLKRIHFPFSFWHASFSDYFSFEKPILWLLASSKYLVKYFENSVFFFYSLSVSFLLYYRMVHIVRKISRHTIRFWAKYLKSIKWGFECHSFHSPFAFRSRMKQEKVDNILMSHM